MSSSQERGIALWNSRQLGRQGTENPRAILHEVVRAAQVILVIVSPEARSSRHVRDAFEMARRYQRAVCGVWIEGERLEQCLPENRVELAALIDARQREIPLMFEETVKALEQVSLASRNGTEVVQPSLYDLPMETIPPANQLTERDVSGLPSEQPEKLVPLHSQAVEGLPSPHQSLELTTMAKSLPAALPRPATSPISSNRIGLPPIKVAKQRKKLARSTAGFLIGLLMLLIGGALLGSALLLSDLQTHTNIVNP